MRIMPKIMLAIAIVLSIFFTAATAASAATKHRRPAHVNPLVYNAGAGYAGYGAGSNAGVGGGISLSTACLGQSPCRTQPDGW
jgi:hypothetical protein